MSTTHERLLLPLAQHPGVNWDSVAVVDGMSSAGHVMRGRFSDAVFLSNPADVLRAVKEFLATLSQR